MKSSTFSFTDQDGVSIFCYKWEPDSGTIKGIIQYAHGLTGYAGPFGPSAEPLTKAGYIIYAEDHRGHGKTAKDPQHLGFLGPNGWDGTLNEIKMLTTIAKNEHPGLPVFLLGHSWGSFLSQDYIQRWGLELSGVILMGSNGDMCKLKLKLMQIVQNKQIKKFGIEAKADLMYKMTFGKYNEAFAPNKTKYDWFSRDEAFNAMIAKDPLLGWVPPNEFYPHMANGFNKIWNPSNEMKIPKDLPILILTGTADMVSDGGKGVEKLVKRYQKYGIKDLTNKMYPGARHVLMNEINKAEIRADLISWLDAHVGKK